MAVREEIDPSEWRLFYVALTRARRSVAMFTVMGKHSAFLDEMVKEGAVNVTNVRGEPIQEDRCPICKIGVFVLRQGPYGEFRSCSSYPMCGHKPSPPKKVSNQRASPSDSGPW